MSRGMNSSGGSENSSESWGMGLAVHASTFDSEVHPSLLRSRKGRQRDLSLDERFQPLKGADVMCISPHGKRQWSAISAELMTRNTA
eukprot:2771512-Amphidinium_carterae.1